MKLFPQVGVILSSVLLIGGVQPVAAAVIGGGGGGGTPPPISAGFVTSGRVAFTRTVGSTHQIFLADGSGTIPLTDVNAGSNQEPAWSPDGGKIAFTSDRDQVDSGFYRLTAIYTMNPNGTDPVRLTDWDGAPRGAAWSPDGTRIAYSKFTDLATGNAQIWVMDADGGNQIQLTNTAVSASNPAWSPDGTKLAYACITDAMVGIRGICTANADGTGEALVAAYGSSPVWSPDGTRLAYNTNTSTNSIALTIANADGSNANQIADNAVEPGWASDGSLVAFGGTGGIVASAPDGSGQLRITDEQAAYDHDPAIAPGPFSVAASPTQPVPSVVLHIEAAQPTDEMLTRHVTLTALNFSQPVRRYEYGWTESSLLPPSTQIQKSTTTHGVLSYKPTKPSEDWYLYVRVVLKDGTVSDWSTPQLVHTPKPPLLLAIGDSITAGHHFDKSIGDTLTHCEDSTYGYAAAYAAKWQSAIPAGAWRTRSDYFNVAYSGFATQMRDNSAIVGSVLEGGIDACKFNAGIVPIDVARQMLHGRAGSWNTVIATGGINDTNWEQTVTDVISTEVAFRSDPNLPRDLTADECRAVMSEWNGIRPVVQKSITGGIRQITNKLRRADGGARMYWLGYYNIAGTGANSLAPYTYMPASCEAPVQEALATVTGVIQMGLPADVTYVPTDGVMHMSNANIQSLYLLRSIGNNIFRGNNPTGWPHPNRAGATAIANLLTP